MDWEDFYGCQLPVLESMVHSLSQQGRRVGQDQRPGGDVFERDGAAAG